MNDKVNKNTHKQPSDFWRGHVLIISMTVNRGIGSAYWGLISHAYLCNKTIKCGMLCGTHGVRTQSTMSFHLHSISANYSFHVDAFRVKWNANRMVMSPLSHYSFLLAVDRLIRLMCLGILSLSLSSPFSTVQYMARTVLSGL